VNEQRQRHVRCVLSEIADCRRNHTQFNAEPAVTELEEFSKLIQSRLISADSEPDWTTEKSEEYMANLAMRRQRFEQSAAHLMDDLVRPRLAILASYFANATRIEDDNSRHCKCLFEHSDRFPAETNVAIAVEHDVSYDKLSICFAARMMPTFVPFNDRDRLTVDIAEVDDNAAGAWIERRLVEFLDAYLRIDSNSKTIGHDTAIDPVCGMRVNRLSAAATTHCLGHEYYFCCHDCCTTFEQDSMQYVKSKPM
jgi:YHS domain-containing protein